MTRFVCVGPLIIASAGSYSKGQSICLCANKFNTNAAANMQFDAFLRLKKRTKNFQWLQKEPDWFLESICRLFLH